MAELVKGYPKMEKAVDEKMDKEYGNNAKINRILENGK